MDVVKSARLFLAIVETGSLSAVARAWGVAPSTVTLLLQQLEERVGTRLLFRTTRQLSLTKDGEHFLERSRKILDDLDDLMEGFREEGALQGHIKITVTNDFGREHIAPLVHAFMNENPQVTIELFLSDQMINLVEGSFDVGIRTGPLQDSDLRARMLLRGKKIVCASPDYWDSHGRPSHPKDLTRHNCLLLGSGGDIQSHWIFKEGTKALRVRVSGDRMINDGQTARQWAVMGAGVVVKSSFDVAKDIKAGRLEPVLLDYTQEATNLYAVSAPWGIHARRTSALLDFLSAELAKQVTLAPFDD